MSVMNFLVGKLGSKILMARDEDGWTAAHSGARTGDLTMLKYIVETAGVIALADQGDGPTVLNVATQHGHTDAIKYLKAMAGGEQDESVTAVSHAAV